MGMACCLFMVRWKDMEDKYFVRWKKTEEYVLHKKI